MKRRLKIQRLKEAWTNPLETGIFTQLQNKGVPWASLNMDGSLNLIYHFNRSGNKIISPLVESYTDNDEALTAVEKSAIGDALVTIYNEKWEKLYELLSLEYDPISNYDMVENETTTGEKTDTTTRTGTDTTTGTGTDTITHTGTEQNANTGTQTTDHTGTRGTIGEEHRDGGTTGTIENGVYGFNSTSAVNDSESETTTEASTDVGTTETITDNLRDVRTDALTATRTDNLTDTETRNITDQTTHNTTDTTTGENEVTRTLTRKGNIGVTTSQQMIQSTIDLWQWNFFTQVFEDIDTLLTISTY